MSRQLVKVAPDRDLYVEWCSSVDGPTFIGTRAEVTTYLGEPVRGQVWPTEEQIEGRLAKADEAGSSAPMPWGYVWDDQDGLPFHNRGILSRARLAELAERYLATPDDDEPDVTDLLVPFEGMEHVR